MLSKCYHTTLMDLFCYFCSHMHTNVLPGSASGKEPIFQCLGRKRQGFNPWVGKILWRRVRQPTPVFLPGESHEQRSLAGYSSWGHKRVRHDLASNQKSTNNIHFVLMLRNCFAIIFLFSYKYKELPSSVPLKLHYNKLC